MFTVHYSNVNQKIREVIVLYRPFILLIEIFYPTNGLKVAHFAKIPLGSCQVSMAQNHLTDYVPRYIISIMFPPLLCDQILVSPTMMLHIPFTGIINTSLHYHDVTFTC